MFRESRSSFHATGLLAIGCSISVLTLGTLAPAQAQNLFLTSNHTIAGGNPLNGTYGQVVVGRDSSNNPFPNVLVDITGGALQYVNALNFSTVNILDGTIGRPEQNGTIFSALNVGGGSTVNFSNGTMLGFTQIGTSTNTVTDTFNFSGGSYQSGFVWNYDSGVINVSGGTISANLQNIGKGTINVTGGSLTSIYGQDFFGVGGGTINFGGTATINRIGVQSGVANIAGGTIGVGGVTVQNSGIANFTGSGMLVNQTGVRGEFDANYFVNRIVADYTITGTLTSGTALNTTVSAGTDFTNSGSLATFTGAGLAPDLYVSADQTVNGVYNYVNVGIDKNFNPFSPTATIVNGADTVWVFTNSASITNMTGGIVRGEVNTFEQSTFNLSGGTVGGIYALDDSTINVSGGSGDYLYAVGNSTVTVSGGSFGFFSLEGGATLTFQGTGLSATGTAGHYFDGYTNYLTGGEFSVIGTLADGTALDQLIVAGGASGNGSQQTLVAPTVAPSLFLTQDTTTNSIFNFVQVTKDTNGVSPTVTVGTGSDIAQVGLSDSSVLKMQDGIVRGSITMGGKAALEVTGGSIEGSVLGYYNTNKVTVTGGTINTLDNNGYTRVDAGAINNLIVYGTADMNGGTADQLIVNNFYGGAVANINGGSVTLAQARSGGTLNVTGGTVGTITTGSTSIINILGGSVTDITSINGGFINLYGGSIGPNTLLNLGSTAGRFTVYGLALALTGGTEGTYTDASNTLYTGAWWDVTGTLSTGAALNTRYFEVNGTTTGPQNFAFVSTAPEPTALLFFVLGGGLALMRRRRAV